MAITTTQQIQDSRYRNITKYVCDAAANTNVSLLDVSALSGFVSVRTSLVTIAKITWTSSGPSGGLDILWDASRSEERR